MRPATWVHDHRPALPHVRPLALPAFVAPLLPRLALLLVLALLLWLGARPLATPEPAPASAPATAFSATRAMEHLRVIAAEPRPIGSAANDATRDYLLTELRALGLEPELQTAAHAVSEGAEGFRAGVVNNVIVRVPGSDSTGAIAINAHYDGANTGPAASDCGSCVVTALEALRATLAGPPLRNDLLVIFSDGEERHMLGAAAFADQHPWAADVRLALNYEATGSGGAAFLYVTSDDNDWLVSQFLDVAPDAAAWSLIPQVAQLMPDARLGSDLDEYTRIGAQGLGFVYTANPTAYHTRLDNVDEIDPGSIQQEGGYTVALVRQFGALDLGELPRSGDSVFFTVLPGVTVQYTARWALALAALTTLLAGALVASGLRRGELTGRGLLAGAAASLGAVLVSVTGVVLLWVVVRAFQPDFQAPMVGFFETTAIVAGLACAAVALVMALLTLLGRRVRPLHLALGAVLAALPVLWLLTLGAPGTSYLVLWPLAFALLPLGWTLLAGERARQAWWQAAVLAIAALPALVLLPATLHQMTALIVRFEGMLGAPILGAVALFVAPVAVLGVPWLRFLGGESASRMRRWALPALTGILAVGLLGWASLTSGFDAEHPRPDSIAWQLDADTGSASWVSEDQRLDDWTRQFFPAGTGRVEHETTLGTVQAFVAPAPALKIAGPEVTVLSDTTDGELRTLMLRFASPRGVTEMTAAIDAAGPIVGAAVDGRPLDLAASTAAADGELDVIYANVQPGGWELTLEVRSSDPVRIELEEVTDGLPALPGTPIAPRPADTMPSPLHPRDATIVTRTLEV